MPSTELSNTVKTCFYSALTLFALAAFAHAQSESIETLGSQHLVSAPAVNNHEHTSHSHSMNPPRLRGNCQIRRVKSILHGNSTADRMY